MLKSCQWCLLCSHWLEHLPRLASLALKVLLNTKHKCYQRLSAIRRSVIFKVPVGHLTKYLVGHFKLVMLKDLKKQQQKNNALSLQWIKAIHCLIRSIFSTLYNYFCLNTQGLFLNRFLIKDKYIFCSRLFKS